MFLGIYRFKGNPDELLPAYDRLLNNVPREALHLHVCVQDQDGLWVYDCCPTREGFQSFAESDNFQNALKAAGLPAPQVTPMGDVHAAFLAGQRTL